MGSSYPGGVTVPRGPWHYDGEIDLGFGAALRMAATIVTRDPIFGWFAYGGVLTKKGNTLEIIPRDGLRRRFDVVIPGVTLPVPEDVYRLKLELDRDGFVADRPIALDTMANRIAFTVENRTSTTHATELKLSFPANATYTLLQDDKPVRLWRTDDWDYPWRAELAISGPRTMITVSRSR
jgi:hypothetical protein